MPDRVRMGGVLIDAILASSEIDLLRARIDWLSPVVDHFIVAESPRTFSGKPKPLHVTENLFRFADVADRLTVVTYDVTNDSRWEVEFAARHALRDAVIQIGDADDIVVVADLDEIPSREQMVEARSITEVRVVGMVSYYRRANWIPLYHSNWPCVKVCPVGQLPENLNNLRAFEIDGVTGLDSAPGGH